MLRYKIFWLILILLLRYILTGNYVLVHIFSLLQTVQEWLWDPPSPLFSGYRELFPREQNDWDIKLTVHSNLVPSLRMTGAVPRLSFGYMAPWRTQG